MNVDIGRFRTRWTLPDPALASLADAVFGRLLDDTALDEAVSRALAGVASTELVAIRTVSVPPMLVQQVADADEWARLIAAAVGGAVAAGGPDVVRYRTTRSARLDVVCRVALGDLRREWAWRRLGLWSTSDAAVAITDMLAAEPEGVVPVLDAAGSVLPAIVDLLGAAGLRRLATESWARRGAPVPAGPGREHRRGFATTSWPELPAAIRGALAGPLGELLVARRSTAAPRQDAGPGPGRDAAFAGRSGDVTSVGAAAEPADRTTQHGEVVWILAALLVAHAEPGGVAAGSGQSLVDGLLRLAADAEGGRVAALPVVSPPAAGPSAPAAAPATDTTAARPDAPDQSAPTGADGAPTGWAGLLFCLNPLRPVLDPRLAKPGARSGNVGARSGNVAARPDIDIASRRYGWPVVLRAVGSELLTLAGAANVAPIDPALLAFCGRPPVAVPPDGRAAAEDRGFGQAVAGLRDDIIAALRGRLVGRPPAVLADDLLLRAVLRRSGRILADPGWLDVHLESDEVSVDLRAAGLDIDPGWLPALGCVVRFCYE